MYLKEETESFHWEQIHTQGTIYLLLNHLALYHQYNDLEGQLGAGVKVLKANPAAV